MRSYMRRDFGVCQYFGEASTGQSNARARWARANRFQDGAERSVFLRLRQEKQALLWRGDGELNAKGDGV